MLLTSPMSVLVKGESSTAEEDLHWKQVSQLVNWTQGCSIGLSAEGSTVLSIEVDLGGESAWPIKSGLTFQGQAYPQAYLQEQGPPGPPQSGLLFNHPISSLLVDLMAGKELLPH